MQDILKFLKDIKPRDYQEEIFKKCRDKNSLVIIPTGLGKTLIGLLLAIERLKKYPTEKVLFLAPTRPLAEQHLIYFQKHLPELFATMELFTGKVEAGKRKELWQRADIVFSTPQCISNDVKKRLYGLEGVSLLIEDEAHRCMKNYAYTYVAGKYNEQAEHKRILGLTASPGHEKEKIKQICKNLDIENVDVRTRESDDVKQYLQELKFEVINVDFPDDFKKIRELLRNIFDRKVEELGKRNLLFGRVTKITLLDLQRRLMRSIASGNKNFNILVGASACAQVLKIQHAMELVETQTLFSLYEYLTNLFKQAEKKESKAVQNIVKQSEFNQAYAFLSSLISKDIEHPKLGKLIELLSDKKRKKVLIFGQYRDTVTKICKEVNKIPGRNARVFVGQAKKGSGKKETGLSQKEQKELLNEFGLGKVNVLAATSIGEEGLDIPEVDTVIFYEPVPSAIRKIQRAGRTARLSKGELIILLTKKTRDEAYHWAAFQKEKKMNKVVSGLKDNMESLKETKKQKDLREFK